MYSAAAIIPFVRRIKNELSDADIWVYSGFTYEEIVQDKQMLALLKLCDVLVDGPFIITKKNPNLRFKGSANQRTINIKKSLESGSAVLLEA